MGVPRILLQFLRRLPWAAIGVACLALVGAVAGHMRPSATFDVLGHRVVLLHGHVSADPWFVPIQLPWAAGRGMRFPCGPLNVWWMAIGATLVALTSLRSTGKGWRGPCALTNTTIVTTHCTTGISADILLSGAMASLRFAFGRRGLPGVWRHGPWSAEVFRRRLARKLFDIMGL